MSLASADPIRFPYQPTSVEVVQTHISVVFLAPPFVYKVKKPVALGFLDFSTLNRRRHFCEQEVALNRRLAPDVYLGVVSVVAEEGGIRFEGEGEPIEWAVKMRWLAPEHSLESMLDRDEATDAVIDSLAGRIAEFHRNAATNEHIAAFGSLEVVAGNARENFEQSVSHIGHTVTWKVFDRVRACSDRLLTAHRELIADRAERGVPRDTHGDLRLDHVYFLPSRDGSHEPTIIDCIEFNDRFRYADPVADIAFLTMDLAWAGRRDLARRFADAYFAASGDEGGRPLLPAYEGYRAAVRAKVNGIQLFEEEVPADRKERAKIHARGHWLLALVLMEEPSRRPGLLLVGGLPGTGKSTLARTISAKHGFEWLRSDVVRKELAGIPETQSASVGFEQGIYDSAWTQHTYDELTRRAEALLLQGGRVLVDASFRGDAQRLQFIALARSLGVPCLFLHCEATPETVRQRLAGRRGDASDADWAVFLTAQKSWSQSGPKVTRLMRTIDAEKTPEETAAQAEGFLRADGWIT